MGKVFLSIEGEIPPMLEKYIISTDAHKILSLLHYAHLYIGDSLTMFTEAALLGTPSISISSEGFLLGNFDELCDRYELGYRFRSLGAASSKIINLSKKSIMNSDWKIKRKKLLDEKIDVSEFQLDLINSCI